jgi:O-antigen/teichoic acid export membrane protein
MEDLKGKAVRGGIAKVFSQAANVLLRVGALMIFARFLEPGDFGLVGMVTAFTGILGLFKDFGLSTVTIQRATITDEQTSTLFWVNLLVGGILWGLSLAIAPLLVAFYHEPRLFWVTIALAVAFVLNAAGVQHSAILQRQMRFVTLSIIEIVSLLVSTVFGIGLAINGYGYWSLVGWSVILPAANSLGVWMVSGWVPGAPQRGVGIFSMLRFGGTISLNILVVYIAYNFDKVLLGRFWGADALGIYGRAYQLINMPTESLIGTIGVVAFPALSRLQDDPILLKNYFLKGYKMVLTLAIPIAIACALFSDDLILVLLGPKWKDAVVIFLALSPLILIFSLINPLGWLLYSIGMVGRSLKIALVIAPLVIAGYIVGLPYGPIGIAFGYSVMMMLWIVPHIVWCIHGTTISLSDIFKSLRSPFISGILSGSFTLGIQLLFGQSVFPVARLLLGSSVLLILYFGLLFWILGEKSFYMDILLTLRKKRLEGEIV